MTIADFFAGSFWPLMVVFGLSLWKLRERNGWGLVLAWTGSIAFAYLAWVFFYGALSIVVIINWMIGMMLIGLVLLSIGAGHWTVALERKAVWRGVGLVVAGLGLTIFAASIIVRDLALPREVIEGRVKNLYSRGRFTQHYVTIADRTVYAIIPDYERLKLKPVVRVEVGRGSEFIYRIDYLAN